MKCSDIMTKDPACCLPSDTTDTVAQMMVSENVGPIPVVESSDSQRLVGIVTDRDLAIKVVAEGRDPKSTRVEAVMTRDPVTCEPGDDVRRALELMEQHQVRRIPVVNDGKIVGIIAQADIATRMEMVQPTAEVVEAVSEPRGRQ